MLVTFLLLMLLFAILLLFVVFSEFLGFVITRVPFVPTTKSDIEFIVKNLEIDSEGHFFDLGSGDGQVVFLVEKLSGAKTTGFELTWWTHLLARLKKIFKKSQARLLNKDFFNQSWEEAGYIYAYLYPPLMRRVEEKFLADCRTGSVAIVRDFPFPNLKAEEVYYRPHNHEIYVYRKSPDVEKLKM